MLHLHLQKQRPQQHLLQAYLLQQRHLCRDPHTQGRCRTRWHCLGPRQGCSCRRLARGLPRVQTQRGGRQLGVCHVPYRLEGWPVLQGMLLLLLPACPFRQVVPSRLVLSAETGVLVNLQPAPPQASSQQDHG